VPLSTTKYRIIAIGTAIVLGLCSLALTIAITGAILGLPGFGSGPGAFLAACYGLLALGVPAFLFYAAIILVDKEWRPDRIFILAVSLFPFMTLATGVVFVREYDSRAGQYFFLAWAGKTGFSFTIVVLTVLEVLTITILKVLLFPRPGSPAWSFHVKIPAFALFKKMASGAKASGAKAAYTMPGTVSDTAETVSEAAGIGFPSPKPLASVQAFKKLERRLAGEPEEQAPPGAGAEDTEPETDEPPAGGAEPGPDTGSLDPEGPDPEDIGTGTPVEVVSVKPRPVPKTKIRGSWKVPVDILNHYPDGEYWIIDEATRAAAVTLRATLEEFHIQAEVTGIRKGPVITMFEILPAPGVKLSKIVNLQDNIALRLAASSVRIVAPIPGKHAVGIEVPNARRNIVSFREIIEGELHREGKREAQIPVVLGKDITGEAQTADLSQMPHLLIAGATGSGKSVCVNSMILSILYQKAPAECRLILIDPKIVELKLYNDIPHLLTPVITEPKRAFQALQYLICEMERRYACLDSMGVRDIKSYNRRIKERSIAAEYLPYIVVVIDEFADLMATTGKELESTVARLAAMSRAVGIHMVLATQRPSIDVITGLIKANIPSRIAFMVASKMDSRIIIDQVGAEKLLGKGDMLYAGAIDPFPIRMQGAFISEEEVETVVEHIKTLGKPDYIDDEIFYDDEDDADPSLFSEGDDPLYEKALEIVLQQGKASASYIQRRLKIGYNRAARLVELMEQKGVVGPAQGSRPRELLRAFSS
jgi:S-DNA-T family DNA segregation ATPase FtsK/SpoIIIE